MWIFTKSGLLSIVEYKPSPQYLQVRARQSHHITDIFPGTVPLYTPDADYHWRIYAAKDIVAERIERLIMDIDYPNFKDAANDDLKNAYLSVWSAGLQLMGNNYARITTLGLNQGPPSWAYDSD